MRTFFLCSFALAILPFGHLSAFAATASPTSSLSIAAAANLIFALDALKADFNRLVPEVRVETVGEPVIEAKQ